MSSCCVVSTVPDRLRLSSIVCLSLTSSAPVPPFPSLAPQTVLPWAFLWQEIWGRFCRLGVEGNCLYGYNSSILQNKKFSLLNMISRLFCFSTAVQLLCYCYDPNRKVIFSRLSIDWPALFSTGQPYSPLASPILHWPVLFSTGQQPHSTLASPILHWPALFSTG